jgi:hypothetical protein
VSDFLTAYIEAALWSSNHPDTGEPLDKRYDETDLAPETLATMQTDCERFIEVAGHLIAGDAAEQAGHDFWLTRNGHGCGFWDGDWEEALGEQLTNLCKRFGGVDLYVGDDGQIRAI